MTLPYDSIEDASEDELGAILGYLAGKTGDRPPILIGGWAVFAYNPYSRSIDIDLVLSSKHRTSLRHWLKRERGYTKKRAHVDGWHGAVKDMQGLGEVIVDIATFEEQYAFEGREERLNFDLALKHHAQRSIGESIANIPTRSLLLLYKAKAAWDRAHRLNHGASDDPTWEASKLVKDRADILALTARQKAITWDLQLLHDQLSRLRFLVGVLAAAPRDEDALARTGIDAEEARTRLEGLLELADIDPSE